ncbi:hypothetical protein PVT71_13685 [Salipiger sp. H15]|uniref:Uncharacterized protein n=1 Tax=Alloyangia sp. H15 TaxID=3029062 RepID=A0AAU8AF04_9RHOB
MTLSLTRVSDVTDLPQYPIPAGERLEAHSYFKMHHQSLLESDFFLASKSRGDWDVLGLAMALWCKAQLQDPVGTLPVEPKRQAWILGMPIETWEGYLRRDPSPLYGWVRCRIIGSGEIRLMHRTVTEVAVDALDWKQKAKDRADADRERQAISRLRKAVAEIGSERLASDQRYVVRLHRWLEDTYPHGNRTAGRILEGMEYLGTTDFRR